MSASTSDVTDRTNPAVDLSYLRVRVDGIEATTRRHEQQITKLDEAVSNLRETMARVEAHVATRTDIDSLRRDITITFAQAASDAQNSIPIKASAWFAVATVVITAIAFLTTLITHHGVL